MRPRVKVMAVLTALPKRPVQVTVVLRGASGERVLDHRITVPPKGTFPNGPRCGEGGPQAGVIVENGELRELP